MIDKSAYKLNRVISPETKYMHLMEAIQEVKLRFLLASLKGETFHVCERVNLRFQVKRWKIHFKNIKNTLDN